MLILLVFRPNVSNGRSYSIEHAHYTDNVAARITTSSAFLDVVSWVRILLGRVDAYVVLVIMYCVGVEALRRADTSTLQEVLRNI